MQQRRKGLRAVAATLPKLTAPTFAKRGLAEAGVITDWPHIVGEALAQRTSPIRLSFPRGARSGGTLQVRADGGTALELQHLEPQIVERINGYFGYRAVARLALLQAPVEHRPAPPAPAPRPLRDSEERALEEAVAMVEDAAIRESLHRLGRAVLSGMPAARSGRNGGENTR